MVKKTTKKTTKKEEPVKKEVKATVSGIYLTGVKGIHGSIANNVPKKKKGFFKQALEKAQEKAGAKPL